MEYQGLGFKVWGQLTGCWQVKKNAKADGNYYVISEYAGLQQSCARPLPTKNQ